MLNQPLHQEIDLSTTDSSTTNLVMEIYPDGVAFIGDLFMETSLWFNPEQLSKLHQALKDHLYPHD